MLTSFFRRHWPAVALAILAGIITSAPSLVWKFRDGVPLGHPANIRIADEWLYFARIREVLDGHPTIGNPYLFEHKAKPPAPVFLGEWLAAKPIGIWPAVINEDEPPVVAFGTIYDLVLPPLALLLTYAGLFLVSRLRWASLLAVILLFFGLFGFGRAVSPQINFLFWLSLFLFIFFLIRDYNDVRRRRRWLTLAAINFGLLFYLYTYYWTFYLALFGIFCFLAFLRGWRREAGMIAAVAAGGLAVAAPYLWFMSSAMRLAEYGETLRRIGMIDTHFPSGIAIVIPGFLLLAAFAFGIWRGLVPPDIKSAFLASGVLAAVIVVNQHVITGKNLEFSSHYLMPSVFWFVFAAAYLLRQFFDRLARLAPYLKAGLVLAVFAVAALKYADFRPWSGPSPAAMARWDRAAPLISWINREVPDDAVIFAPGEVSSLIPIYTSANVYFSGGARFFFLSDEELIERFIISHYFDEINEELIRRNVRALAGVYDINIAGHARQGNKVRRLFGLSPEAVEPFPASLPNRVFRHEAELRAMGFERALKRYRADYMIWDRESDPAIPYDAMPFLYAIRDQGPYRVYAVR